jgi:hypothetical protein
MFCLLVADRSHPGRPLRGLQIPKAVLSVERSVPRHIAEGRKGHCWVPRRLGPFADGGQQSGPEPAPAVRREDGHLLDVDVALPDGGDPHADRRFVVEARHPYLSNADKPVEVLQGERHIERLVDESESGEQRGCLILDLSQTSHLLRPGKANPVGQNLIAALGGAGLPRPS